MIVTTKTLGSKLKNMPKYKDAAVLYTMQRIRGVINRDPEVSGITTIILTTEDFGPTPDLNQLIKDRHPKMFVAVINTGASKNFTDHEYLYSAKLSDTRAITEVLESIKQDQVDYAQENEHDRPVPVVESTPIEEGHITPEEKEELTASLLPQEPEQEEEPPSLQELFSIDDISPLDKPLDPETLDLSPILDKPVTTWEELDSLADSLNNEQLVKTLLTENNQYVGAVQTIDMLEGLILKTMRDPLITNSEKLEQVKGFAQEATQNTVIANNAMTEKAVNLIYKVTHAAEAIANESIMDVKRSVQAITEYGFKDKLDTDMKNLLQQRTAVIFELLQAIATLVKIVTKSDTMVTNIISDMAERKITNNSFINTELAYLHEVIKPEGVLELSNQLMTALAAGQMTVSVIESNTRSLIDIVFRLFKTDEDIILEQARWIEYLKRNRVEDAVVASTILKSFLHVFIGQDKSGKSAVSLVRATERARQGNAVIIDLTQGEGIAKYGVVPISIDKFLTGDATSHSLVVVKESLGTNYQKLTALIKHMERLVYKYKYFSILLDEDQYDLINELSTHALTINYCCSCDPRDLQATAAEITNNKEPNIAKRIIFREPPVSVAKLVTDMGVDPLSVQVVAMPHIDKLRTCAYIGANPGEDEAVTTVVETVFKGGTV